MVVSNEFSNSLHSSAMVWGRHYRQGRGSVGLCSLPRVSPPKIYFVFFELIPFIAGLEENS